MWERVDHVPGEKDPNLVTDCNSVEPFWSGLDGQGWYLDFCWYEPFVAHSIVAQFRLAQVKWILGNHEPDVIEG